MTINRPKFSGLAGIVSLLVIGFLAAATAQAANITVNVVDNDGNSVDGFRYLLQEDTTFAVDPAANPATPPPR